MSNINELQQLGLTLIEEFITPQKEQQILALLKKTPKKVCSTRNTMRRFGSRHPYPLEPLAEDTIPVFLEELCQSFVDKGLLTEAEKPDSITINEYYPGQAIGFHIDSPGSGPVITVLSLLSSSPLNFKNEAQNKTLGVTLPPRSLMQIRDKIRDEWQHGTSPAKAIRYSIVFRKGTDTGNANSGSFIDPIKR